MSGGPGTATCISLRVPPAPKKRRTMTHKLRIALAATLLALAAVSGTDTASAGSYGGGDFAYFGFGSRVTDLAPQPTC
jgi:hypothetical protein